MFAWTLLAQGEAPSGLPDALVMVVLFVVIFYFILFRPEMKKRKAHEAMLDDLKAKDRILTQGGLYGTIVKVKDGDLIIRLDESEKVHVRVSRNFIVGKVDEKGKPTESE